MYTIREYIIKSNSKMTHIGPRYDRSTKRCNVIIGDLVLLLNPFYDAKHTAPAFSPQKGTTPEFDFCEVWILGWSRLWISYEDEREVSNGIFNIIGCKLLNDCSSTQQERRNSEPNSKTSMNLFFEVSGRDSTSLASFFRAAVLIYLTKELRNCLLSADHISPASVVSVSRWDIISQSDLIP